ncbi:PLP-dependent aminotransferase family protein [Azorhizobium caulinodans]|uniref:aminotransferase-like domain-containing protein n=1 Tax=Azorhizobium caulinodans TaxID=7 RepID=UPI002FBECBB3
MSDTAARGDYRALADSIAADIAAGRLSAGTRLPPQREFAYQHGIAASTASRVYGELTRRGLISGEVGRGSYVRARRSTLDDTLGEPVKSPLDLQLNFPVLPGQEAEVSAMIARLTSPGLPASVFAATGAAGTPDMRALSAGFLGRAGWRPDADGLVFTNNGRQAIAAALAALAPPGERIGVEALTYPAVKWLAARLGVTLVPLPMDGQGLRPDALLKAHRTAPLAGVYLQSSLHNPLGVSMDAARRREIATLLRAEGLMAIEDTVYGFLSEEEPLAAATPDHVLLVDSLSKRVAPGLTLGFIAGPASWSGRLVTCVRSGAWTANGLTQFLGTQVMAEGLAARLVTGKRADARDRQALAGNIFPKGVLKADPRSYHSWLELPDIWRAETFAAAATRQGIAVTPASAFAVPPTQPPNAIRIALSRPPLPVLREALLTLRRLLESGPQESEVE